MRRKPTKEQKEQAEQRRAAMRVLAKTISELPNEKRLELASKTPVIKLETGKMYSPYNTCLIVSQKPDATVCGGFNQWLKQGRVPKGKGCGICIKVPCGKKVVNDEGEKETIGVEYFTFGTVFDVSDTVEKAERADS